MKISDLTERYGLSRQAFYNRVDAIGIALDKDERGRINASSEQIARLDELNEHIKQGGNLANFSATEPIEMEAQIDDSAIVPVPPSMSPVNQAETPEVYEDNPLEALIGAIAANIQPRSPLWKYRELEEAADKGWILDSGTVRELIGVQPKGEFFERGGWQFYRVGRVGRSFGWRVSKKLYSE